MSNLAGADRSRYVRSMFARIAGRYDLMNRLMTAGQDSTWRRQVLRLAAPQAGQRLLDLGAGTGDLSFEAMRQRPGLRPIAADFTPEMMRIGQNRPNGNLVSWSAADALRLPFSEAAFEAVVSGFLLRNVPDVPAVLIEVRRVLKPGGRFVNLDTTHPPSNVLTPFIRFHLHTLIPLMGRWIAGQGEAYTYLPDSTENFLTATALASLFEQAGLTEVHFQRRMFGTIAIHWATKP